MIFPNNSMRFPRVKAEGPGFYHCLSRVVEGRFIFQTTGGGSLEAERFVGLMRRLEAFSGVEVLTYALMSNHFHLSCYVPERVALSEKEVLARIAAGYGGVCRQEVEAQLAQWRQHPGGEARSQALLERYRRRMYDLSIFVKELKGGFAQWYNRRQERYGVLWAERFKSLLVEGGEALATVAAYIELNPVRAGLCRDPKEYRYCGYAEAQATGGTHTRLRRILGQASSVAWEKVLQLYGQYLFGRDSSGDRQSKAAAFAGAKTQQVVEAQEGELWVGEALRSRLRYFTEGVILGSQSFVQSHLERLRQKLGYRRKRSAQGLNLSGPFWVLRKVRVRAVG